MSGPKTSQLEIERSARPLCAPGTKPADLHSREHLDTPTRSEQPWASPFPIIIASAIIYRIFHTVIVIEIISTSSFQKYPHSFP